MPSFQEINGRLHHYRLRTGNAGRAIVFVNSLGTDLRIWDGVIEKLPQGIPTLAYDKSGHGLSAGGAISIEDFAADLAGLMDALGLRDALVCGVSVGGMIAQVLASTRPDLVAGLVLCNTGHRIGTVEAWTDRITTLDTDGIDPMADGILERWFASCFRDASPEVVTGYRIMLTRTPVTGYRAVCAAIRDADLKDHARRIVCPTVCVAGSDDLATPPDVLESLAALISGAQFELYPSVGHLPCIEVPDMLADEIIKHREALT